MPPPLNELAIMGANLTFLIWVSCSFHRSMFGEIQLAPLVLSVIINVASQTSHYVTPYVTMLPSHCIYLIQIYILYAIFIYVYYLFSCTVLILPLYSRYLFRGNLSTKCNDRSSIVMPQRTQVFHMSGEESYFSPNKTSKYIKYKIIWGDY